MKKLIWILLALPTLPTTVLANTATQSTTTTTATESTPSVNAAGLPVSGSETTTISNDPAATAAPVNTSGAGVASGSEAIINTDPAATAAATAAVAPVGPRPGGPNKGMLPEEFKVYYNAKLGISQKAFKGSTEKVIPTKNEFTEVPGCYISCYTKDPKKGVYQVGENTYVIGQIRVSGHYYGGNCLPKGFENKDVRTAKEFKEMCEKNFPEKCEKESCTANSNHTAQWFN
jgi:hypothetical protein